MGKLRYNKTFKGIIIVISVCILVSTVVVTAAIASKIQYEILVADMQPIEATVTEIDWNYVRSAPDIQEIYITYEVDDKVYNCELKTDTTISFASGTGTNYSVGDKLNIFYDPQNPNIIATPLSVKVGYYYLIICLIILCLLVPALIYLLKHKSKFLVTREEYEKQKAGISKSVLLNHSGQKIRWQYFNVFIYTMLSICCAVAAMIITVMLKADNFNFGKIFAEMVEAIPVVLTVLGVFLGPFIVLSILNRLCFGSVLGVVNESTLLLKEKEVSINDIIEIVYHPRMMLRGMNYCYATFIVHSKNNKTESFDVVHFPSYGIRLIKKYNKNVKISCDKYIWFIFCPTVIFAIMGLLLG